jgi:N-acetyl-beta-hexosaminidase
VCQDTVTPALTRAQSNAFYFTGEVNTTGATLVSLSVQILAEKATDLQLGANESYTLSINSTDAVIVAQTEWGALHGIESFVALVGIEPWEQPVRYFLRDDAPLLIVDEPRWEPALVLLLLTPPSSLLPTHPPPHSFVLPLPLRPLHFPRVRWRGIMLDTARHYISVPNIYKGSA